MKKQLLLLVLLILPLVASADTVEIDGIYYNLNLSGKTAEVESGPNYNYYSGHVIIPDLVKHKGNEFHVTSIAQNAFLNCHNLSYVEIPNGVLSMGSSAFASCGIITVNIPSSLQKISYMAFSGCMHLASVTISQGIEEIEQSAFYSCSSLTSLVIPNSVVAIGEDAFEDCTSLNELVFEDGEDTLQFSTRYQTSYSKPKWFLNCPLYSIYLGRNINYQFTTSGSTYHYSPFREMDSLRTVVLGNNVTMIPDGMFNECSNLISVEIPERMDYIGPYAFSGCEKLSSFVLPYGITKICAGTFNNCKSLTTINVPETVSCIEEQAFYCCEKLIALDIPSSVNSIETYAFGGCTNLSDLKFRDGNTSITIRDDNFRYSPITSIYLGRNIINNSSNYIYSSLGSIATPFNLTISKYVTELKGGTFAQCEKILSITFEEGADTLTLINNHNAYNSIMPFAQTPIDSIYLGRVIVGKDAYYPNRTIIPFYNVGSSFVMQIGNNFTEIGDQSYNSWNISSVTIPNNVQRIGFAAFGNCSSLKHVIIDDGENNLDFGIGDKNYSCFYGCSINSLYLGRNLTYSQYSPFRRNISISSLVLGDKVTEIGEALFSGFKSLLSIDLPENLTKIGKQAFYGCEGLTTLTIPSSVTEIGQQAFDLCRGLKTLTFEDGKEDLKFSADPNYVNNAFVNSPLEEIYLGRNIIYQNISPFFAIESIKELTLGSKVTRLNDRVFAGCPNLEEVYSYSETVPTTGGSVFTETYLQNAILNVPYSLYDEYRVTEPWNKFGNIHNFEGKYNLYYFVDGEEYQKYVISVGESIATETEPTKEGYTFSGWSEIPTTMPAHDVTVTGTFSINSYKLTYIIDDKVYKEAMYEYGATITPEPQPEGDYATFEWTNLPQTMPAHDVVVYANYANSPTGITEVPMATQRNFRIYSPNGKKLDKLQKGLNIVVLEDGTVKKVMVK